MFGVKGRWTEGDSEHPIARGIRDKAEEKKLSLPKAKNFEAIKGHGVQATVNDKTAHVGGPRMLQKSNATLPETLEHFTKKIGEKGQTVVYLFIDMSPVAAFALADLVRQESKEAIQQLQSFGIELIMLTGDSYAVAKAVADELGIQRFYAEVLPEDKDQKIKELQNEDKL